MIKTNRSSSQRIRCTFLVGIFQCLLVWCCMLHMVQCADHQLIAQNVCTVCECSVGLGGPNGDELEVSIDCSERNLKDLPVDWPYNITAAEDMADARLIASFSRNQLGTLKKLPETEARNVSLSFRHCGLTELVNAAFLDIPYIEELDLSHNKLTTESLHGDVLRGHYDERRYEPMPLRVLLLSHNSLSNGLQASALEHTPDLRILDLSHNNIRELQEATIKAIATAKMLEVLDLSYTGISMLPQDLMKEMSRLRELNLRGNNFLVIPESLAVVGRTLQHLDVSYNPVGVLGDESFLGLSKLEYLRISHMPQLTSVMSNTFTSLVNLKVLKMERCSQLKHIDKNAFMNISVRKDDWKLEELYLQDGNLTTLPTSLLDWPPLKVLDVDGNPWHCDCHLAVSITIHNNASMKSLARCNSPYDRAGMLISAVAREHCVGRHALGDDGTIDDSTMTPRSTQNESPYSRPSVIAALVLFVVILGTLGIALGCLGSCLRERLRRGGMTGQPVKYTHVGNSINA